MSEDTTPDPAVTDESAGTGTGQKAETGKTESAGGTAAKTPDPEYVKSLRKEATDNRKRAEAAEARAKELEDRDKSEAEKLASRAAESEARATEAEARLLRLEVAATRNMRASAVPLLHGSTREEIEASADALEAYAKDTEKPATGFDGGARKTPDETKPPEAAHNEFLLRAMGKTPPA